MSNIVDVLWELPMMIFRTSTFGYTKSFIKRRSFHTHLCKTQQISNIKNISDFFSFFKKPTIINNRQQ